MAEPSDRPAINDGLGGRKKGGVVMKKKEEMKQKKKVGKNLSYYSNQVGIIQTSREKSTQWDEVDVGKIRSIW